MASERSIFLSGTSGEYGDEPVQAGRMGERVLIRDALLAVGRMMWDGWGYGGCGALLLYANQPRALHYKNSLDLPQIAPPPTKTGRDHGEHSEGEEHLLQGEGMQEAHSTQGAWTYEVLQSMVQQLGGNRMSSGSSSSSFVAAAAAAAPATGDQATHCCPCAALCAPLHSKRGEYHATPAPASSQSCSPFHSTLTLKTNLKNNFPGVAV